MAVKILVLVRWLAPPNPVPDSRVRGSAPSSWDAGFITKIHSL
jgi:hypothetical protein